MTGYRALDVADEKGLVCGKILADLGVNVIIVEAPSGNAACRIGPFAQGIPDPERSLFWWAFSANKRR